jgi:hypothetical protein
LELLEAKVVQESFAVYLGARAFMEEGLLVLPYEDFLTRLYKDEVWGG